MDYFFLNVEQGKYSYRIPIKTNAFSHVMKDTEQMAINFAKNRNMFHNCAEPQRAKLTVASPYDIAECESRNKDYFHIYDCTKETNTFVEQYY